MEDEEAKRIQEERDKQLTEEYKDVTNPKNPEEKEVDLVEIAKRKNPDYLSIIKEAFGDITESGEVWDESRQQFLTQKVAPLAQKVDDSLTNITGQNWVGDRSRNVINFGADILTPTSGDLAVGAAVLPLTVADGPLPFGDAAAGTIAGLKYGSGVTGRLYKKTSQMLDDVFDKRVVQKAAPVYADNTSSFVKRPNFGSAEEALTAGYGGKSFERLMKSKRHLNKYGDSAEEAAAFMQRGWNHFAVNKTLRGMEGGRYITLSNGQVLKLRTNTAASKINVEKMTGLSLKNDLSQEAYRLKRNLGTQFDIPKLQTFANKSGYPPEAVTAYIKAAKEHNKKIDELVKYLNKKGGSVMWSKGHYRAVENLIQMGTGDKASADMITNVFLQKLSPNSRMQAKHDLPHLLNLASNRAASVEEDFLKFVEPELFGSFWPKLTGKYKTVFIDRVLNDMQKASGKGIDIRDIIEENVNLILEDTNLIETMGRIKFNANKVYPWLQKHGVNIKANFNVK